MTITGALASLAVSDLDRAEAWYGALFGREPDTRPMDGLLEWHLPGGAGGGPAQATSSRILQLADPDGNRVVLTGR